VIRSGEEEGERMMANFDIDDVVSLLESLSRARWLRSTRRVGSCETVFIRFAWRITRT
jgi:hypothetical protein